MATGDKVTTINDLNHPMVIGVVGGLVLEEHNPS